MTVERTLGQDLADWEQRVNAWTWSSSPGQMPPPDAVMRRWATDNGWPLDRRVELERTIQWRAFDVVSPEIPPRSPSGDVGESHARRAEAAGRW